MRIDQLLVQRGLASTRSQAQRLIGDGVEWMQADSWRRIVKNGDEVPEGARVRLLDDSEARYVSRGGLKLEAALKQTALSVAGSACLDVGQSTGGFTDCLLKSGAASVVGVDVGSAQLHPSLRNDPRVMCIEGVNARTLVASDLIATSAYTEWDGGGISLNLAGEDGADLQTPLAPAFDLAVIDVSFISQTLMLPSIVALLKPGGVVLSLVKPQFELQPGQVGKGGIVRDAASYLFVEKRLRDACADAGLTVHAWFDSPIAGGDGNREFFIHASKPV
jgi:23S rRNA (cytidine1920-2'-O)/16S rRNA (cytidine1409-2'-O)-methyltransferase